jgi:hypothetical protein
VDFSTSWAIVDAKSRSNSNPLNANSLIDRNRESSFYEHGMNPSEHGIPPSRASKTEAIAYACPVMMIIKIIIYFITIIVNFQETMHFDVDSLRCVSDFGTSRIDRARTELASYI